MMKTILLILTPMLLLALDIGKHAPHLLLQGEDGARVNGEPFDSTVIKEKVYVLFYVDPDEKGVNDAVSEALKGEDFNKTKFGSIAIINMKATWLPNFAIASTLKAKQAEFPHTIYVKDLTKQLVEKWQLADDSSDVVLFDKQGIVRFVHHGKLSKSDINTLIKTIYTYL